jgi:exopolysaccharide production protein ExoZ
MRVNIIKFLTPVLCGIALTGVFYTSVFLINPIVIEFLFGMIVGVTLRFKFNIYTQVSLVIFGIAGILLLPPESAALRTIFWGIPAFLIIISAVQWTKVPTAFIKIGDASYSLYLSHIFVCLIVGRLIGKRPETVMVFACCVASVGVSVILYRWIENPVTMKLKALANTLHAQQLPVTSVNFHP